MTPPEAEDLARFVLGRLAAMPIGLNGSRHRVTKLAETLYGCYSHGYLNGFSHGEATAHDEGYGPTQGTKP